MLKNVIFPEKPGEEELKARLKAAREKLAGQQTLIKEHKLPVLVLVEGWGTAGKGSVIGQMIRNIDPRFFKVAPMDQPTEEERRKPFLCRYFTKIPEAGKFMFLDSGWMDEVTRNRVHGEMDQKTYEQRIDSIRRFERQLTDNGYLVMKLFCHISEKEQKKRIEDLVEDIDTRWRVSENDKWQNKHYEKCLEVFDRYMEDTNNPSAPWYVIDAKSKKWAELQALEILTQGIEIALQNQSLAVPLLQNVFPLEKVPKLSEIPLENKSLSDEEYKEELTKLQNHLKELHNRLYRKKVPVVIVYEGWDAAGKGGAIKRLTEPLDPRGYEVVPTAAPNDIEKAHHYLWRFWRAMPKDGHMTIFDRTWYGRVMVERIEGFCSQAEWRRAYREINQMEQNLTDHGVIVLKFWLQIDKDEQERRFNERMEDPEKQWKITDEDWRNREKWDAYVKAVDEMILRTSTTYAPWTIVEADSKYYARIKILETVVRALKNRI